ncbi:MAG: AtaL-like protein [Oxalobacter sp.]
MKFEHLLEINNFDHPQAQILAKEQVWKGLLMWIQKPTLFIPHLEKCDVTELMGTYHRSLDYGKFSFQDKVTCTHMEKIVFDIPAQGDMPSTSLVVTLEEPFNQRLFVRFIYENTVSDEGPEAKYNGFLKSAWEAADVDIIRLIHEMAATGQLDDAAL